MTDGDTLLEAIRASPDDLALRLVYADWFEEQGDQPRADFIRASLDPTRETQEMFLLHRHRLRWDGAVLRRLNAGPLRGMVSARRGPIHRWEYRCGCIESLTVQPDTFAEHGPELLRLGPIRELRLVRGRVPWGTLAKEGLLARLSTLTVRQLDQLPLDRSGLAGLVQRTVPCAEIFSREGNPDPSGSPAVRERRLLGKPGGLRVTIL